MRCAVVPVIILIRWLPVSGFGHEMINCTFLINVFILHNLPVSPEVAHKVVALSGAREAPNATTVCVSPRYLQYFSFYNDTWSDGSADILSAHYFALPYDDLIIPVLLGTEVYVYLGSIWKFDLSCLFVGSQSTIEDIGDLTRGNLGRFSFTEGFW